MNEHRDTGGRTVVAAAPKHWKLTAEQYQRMGEAGILHEDDRVELLEGELYEVAPIGDWHNASVDALNAAFKVEAGPRAIVRVQGSFRLSPRSEPEPDILVLRYRPDYYRSALPGPEDVLLLVEVADTTLAYDRDFKLPLYARAGIPEVWIADLAGHGIERHAEPDAVSGVCRATVRFGRGVTVAALMVPQLAVPVDDVLR